MDMILVGDSLAMVALGMEDTSEVILEEMILHCKSVARATKAAFTVRLPRVHSFQIYCPFLFHISFQPSDIDKRTTSKLINLS